MRGLRLPGAQCAGSIVVMQQLHGLQVTEGIVYQVRKTTLPLSVIAMTADA